MNLTLTTEQVRELSDLLDTTLRDMSFEIAATENPGYRLQLNTKRDVLRDLADRLQGSPAPPVAHPAAALDRELAYPGG
jgi:hypothetical protein